MEKFSWLSSSIILAISVFLTKLIGVFYRIPLVNIIGAEGIGMYQQIFAVFAFILTMVSGAVPMGLSKLIAEEFATNGIYGAKKCFVGALKSMMLIGLVGSTLIYLFAYPIAYIQGNVMLETGYFAIAPSILLVAFISAYRGYFQGMYNIMPTAISQLIEQIFKLLFGLILAYKMGSKGVSYAVGGVLLGITISEIAALIYLMIKYRIKAGSIRGIKADIGAEWTYIKKLFPFSFANMIMPFTALFDSVLIVSLLVTKGLTRDIATSQYGLLTGAVGAIINLPVTIALTVSLTIVPIISKLVKDRQLQEVQSKANLSIKTSHAIGVFCSFILFIIADGAIELIYPNLSQEQTLTAIQLLKISGMGILFIIDTQILSSVLQATGKLDEPIYLLIIIGVVKIVTTLIFTLTLNIVGAAIASVIAYILGTLLFMLSINKRIGRDFIREKCFATILLAGVIMYLSTYFIGKAFQNTLQRAVICGIVGMVIYLVLVVIMRVFSKEELSALPIIRKFFKKREV